MVEYAETLREQDEKQEGSSSHDRCPFNLEKVFCFVNGLQMPGERNEAWFWRGGREKQHVDFSHCTRLLSMLRWWVKNLVFALILQLGDHHERFHFHFWECFHFWGSHQKALAWTEFYAKGSPVSFVEWFVLKNSHIWNIWKWIHSFVEVSH